MSKAIPGNRRIDDPFKALATAILMQAIAERRIDRPKFISFVQSNWFDTLCDLARINPDAAREALHIPAKRRETI